MYTTRSPNQPVCGGKSTYLGEIEEDMRIHTAEGAHTLPYVDSFKIWGHVFNQIGRMQESVNERMQRANNA